MVGHTNLKDMHGVSKGSRSGHIANKQIDKETIIARARSNSNLSVPRLSPMPRHRLSPVLDEFSLRHTPSRGTTASPAPAKGVRKRLHSYHNFDDAAKLIGQSRNIVVLTGAGISTSVGIPDFRSDKGLYSQLSKDLGITEAEEFFSRDYFIHNTQQFFQYVRRVIPEAIIGSDGCFKATKPTGDTINGVVGVPNFSLTHAFLALLHSKHKLLTNYTQNIDGLELAAGVPRDKFIQCHGSWDTASCMTCGRSSAARKYLPVVLAGNIPFCKCKLEAERTSQKKKKKKKKKQGKKRPWEEFDSDHSSDDGTQAPRGLLKPDITFFNERLSGSFNERLDEDKRAVDLLIIVGTSLKVGPVQDMLYQISPKVPQIFISRERFSGALCNLPGVQVDIELLGECDVIIGELCRRAGWTEELKSLCWEKGQMKIKEPSADMSESKQVQKSGVVEDRPIPQSTPDERPFKKARMSRKAFMDGEPILDRDKGLQDISASSADKAAKISGKVISISEEVVQSTASDKKPTATANTCTRQTKLTVELEEPGIFTQVEEVSKSEEDRVKIELVEGTAHQWRVTQK